ncbi:MAG: Rpn family recombination-promoting nuclease/putative transposase [Proteobacteria bacterium]|nr:Rpn family recombination-promoting nuclease/putative transposase [Pseudomonadota bacterium]
MKRNPSYDTSYKALFSCPEVVRDLLRGYVPGKWLENADYESLTRVNASYVSRNDRQRHDDMVWRIDIGGQWLWVYILLEFQSESDPWMAVRMMQYVSLLAEQLIKEGVQNGLLEARLPSILPIVLYNGKPEWRAPLDVADCFHTPPDGLEEYRPRLHYLLLDERRLQQHPLREVKNFADAVFRMEASRRLPDVIGVVSALEEILRAPGLQTVRRAFGQWIKALLQRRATASMIEEIGTIRDVFEELEMLTERKETWFDDEIEQSFLQGCEKGREKGREEGRKKALMFVARNMLKCGKSVKEIAEATGLQPEAIQSLMH